MTSYPYTKGVVNLDHIHLLQALNGSYLHKNVTYTYIDTHLLPVVSQAKVKRYTLGQEKKTGDGRDRIK